MTEKLAGFSIEELKRAQRDKNLQWQAKERNQKQRNKWIVKRVKLLLPYQEILGPGVRACDGKCPRCQRAYLCHEEVWSWWRSTVYELETCTNPDCRYEYGTRYPYPSSGLP